ncbi:MAG TPA: alpha-1,4-glucan--maltose-1-phosphate maltosyltransferase [Pseudomonadales bacterium]
MKPHKLSQLKKEGRLRIVIENVTPEVDAGRFPVKRVTGEFVDVEVDLFADGHESVAGDLLYRAPNRTDWQRTPLRALVNDRFTAHFQVTELGRYTYTVEAWADPFATWRSDLEKRRGAGQDLAVPLEVGARLVDAAAARREGDERAQLEGWAARLRDEASGARMGDTANDPELAALMRASPDPQTVRRYPRELEVLVERPRAAYGAWYEFFPRSCGPEGRHGTFADCGPRLEHAARMGFDIVYLPPIHPIGRTARKGPNNDPDGGEDAVGSPWAIGAAEGGHKSVHPELGTLEDFRRFVARAAELGLEVALDIAFQCAPDHPYVQSHPEWFRHRPDGSIQYAENPPKRYQDIYPLDFECDDYASLWQELYSVVEFWIQQGVTVFRVDNPHTKPFRFWEWLIHRIKRRYPETVFLSEAFTRPKVMHHLAKLGFSQSYTYFTWRNTKQELIEYFEELTQQPSREYFRPNVWPNTPDILHEFLQQGGRPAFAIRYLLAATLAANYGIYGPAFELYEHRAVKPGSEEYLDSEKYQLRHWDVDRPDSLAALIGTVNRIRRAHRVFQDDWNLRFHPVDNDMLLAYSKRAGDEVLLMVVVLDPRHTQSGWVTLPLDALGLPEHDPYIAHDLLTGARYQWHGPTNFVMLDPNTQPGHVLRLVDPRRHDYDYPSFLSSPTGTA